ncbi:alpha/beta hydrolase family protein [Teredinibacter haidensis]|uniref:alpha/beta hydrolase family protein n=1 Tax=Teredinibacter haidensis TaxID=2731755 RepID=UPI000948B272|nr:prolyl oligopeptidase family serine peptidase [Teredinibacter haidensis]
MLFIRLGTSFALFFVVLFSQNSTAVPSLADYAATPNTSMMAMSPSGELIAYRKNRGEKDFLVVYSLKDKKQLHVVDVSEIDPRYIYFFSETQLILVASEFKRMHLYIRNFDVSTAFLFDMTKGSIAQLLKPGHKIHKYQSGLGSIVGITPDAKYAFMPAFVAEPGTDNRAVYSLAKVNLENPEKLQIFEYGKEGVRDYFVNLSGELIAQERYSNKRNLYQVLVPKGGAWAVIYEQNMEVIDLSVVGVVEGGESLVLLREGKDSDRMDYFTLSLMDGSISETGFGREDKDIEDVIVDVNREAYGVRYSGFNPSYQFFDEEVNSFVEQIVKSFPQQSVRLNSWSDDWGKVIVLVEGSDHPGDYYLVDRDLKFQFLATRRENITADDLNPIGKVRYSAMDGLKIPALLTIPKNKVGDLKKLPTVIFPHGGPAYYDRIEFDWLAQSLASQGYLVVQPQFRGSKGFGGEFFRAGHGEWGGKMQSDITDGVNFLVKKGIVDPERICIVGGSYGGYAALSGAAFTPDLYKCVVSLNGVSDLPKMLDMEKRDLGNDHWVVSYWERAMARGDVKKERLKTVSPVYSAESFSAPVLLIHGDRDTVVPIDQSKRMRSKLKKAGKQVEFIKLKGEGHHIDSGEARREVLEAVVDFVGKHI